MANKNSRIIGIAMTLVLVVALVSLVRCSNGTAVAAPSDISLREYVDARFDAMDKQTALALASVKEQTSLALTAAKEAVVKAELATDKRFDGVNEFRAALGDNSRLMMPRTEAEQQFVAINEKVDNLTIRMNALEDRQRGKSDGWLFLIAAVGGMASVGAIYMMVRVRARGK